MKSQPTSLATLVTGIAALMLVAGCGKKAADTPAAPAEASAASHATSDAMLAPTLHHATTIIRRWRSWLRPEAPRPGSHHARPATKSTNTSFLRGKLSFCVANTTMMVLIYLTLAAMLL